MKWFKHDSDSNQDAKLRKLRIKHGMRGYGLYWYCLELIAHNVDEHNLTFELEHDAEILAHDTGMDSSVIEEMMRYMVSLGLFEAAEGRISCLKMLKRIDTSMTSSQKMRELITEAKSAVYSGFMQARMPSNHDHIMIESCGSHDGIMQEEKRRDKKNNKGDEYAADFLLFWSSWPIGYGAKGSKADAAKEWGKVKPRPDVQALIAAVTAQADEKAATRSSGAFAPDFKHVCRWLKSREWENDAPTLRAVSGEVYR